MELSVITEEEEFLSMGSEWNHLLSKSNPNEFFSTHEWLSTWWRHFGKGKDLFIITVREGKEILALAPFMTTRLPLLRRRKIEFLGTGLSDYLDFIIMDKREKCLAAVFDWLLRRRDWAMIDLRCMKEESPNTELLINALERRNCLVEVKHDCYCLRVETEGDWEDYHYNSMTRNLRHDLRRRKNGLRRLGQVSVERYVVPDRIREVMELFFQAHINQLKAMRKCSLFEDQSMRRFYRSLVANLAGKNMLDFTALTIEGKPIGYYVDFLYNDKLYTYSTTYEMDFAKYSPGKLLLEALIKRAFDAGLREVDLMRGEESYKYLWTNKRRKLIAIAVYSKPIYEKLLHPYYTKLRPVLQMNKTIRKLRKWGRKRISCEGPQ